MESIYVNNLFDFEKTIATDVFSGVKYPFEVLPRIGDFIEELSKKLDKSVFSEIKPGVFAAKSAKIAETAHIDAPCIIDENAEIRHCAFIRGKAIIGKNCVVGNSTELKNVILFDNVQVPHYNYVGDSILGYRSHMGAGSITSNVKSDKTNVVIKGKENIETNLKKVGAFLGDYVEIGCGSVLNPGTVIGRNSSVYPLSSVRGVVPDGSIYKKQGEVAKRV